MTDWDKMASQLLRVELKKQEVGYKKLVQLLERIEVHETESSITHKLARGKFSLAFFLSCMSALGHKRLDIELPRDPKDPQS